MNPTYEWDQTYCVLSKYIVIMIMVGTLFYTFNAITTAIISLKWYETHEVNGFELCMNDFVTIQLFRRKSLILLTAICDLINFTQAFEWKVMIVLINAQHKRGIGTIYHNHMVSNCSTVRSTEHVLRKIYYVCLVLILVNSLMLFIKLE